MLRARDLYGHTGNNYSGPYRHLHYPSFCCCCRRYVRLELLTLTFEGTVVSECSENAIQMTGRKLCIKVVFLTFLLYCAARALLRTSLGFLDPSVRGYRLPRNSIPHP